MKVKSSEETRNVPMSTMRYSDLVDQIHGLDLEQKLTLANMLHGWIVEERRLEIVRNGEQAIKDHSEGILPICSSADEVLDVLNAGD
jgi:hypothetical protein